VKEIADLAPMQFGTARLQSNTARVEGEKGFLTQRYDMPAIDKTDQPWLLEAGGWKWDACT